MINWGRLEDVESCSILGVMLSYTIMSFGSPGTAKRLFLTKWSCLNKHSMRIGKQPSFLPVFSSLIYFTPSPETIPQTKPNILVLPERLRQHGPCPLAVALRQCACMCWVEEGQRKAVTYHHAITALQNLTKSRAGFQLLRGERFLSPICHAHGPKSTLLLQWMPGSLSCPSAEQGLKKFQRLLGSRSYFPSLQRYSESLILHF